MAALKSMTVFGVPDDFDFRRCFLERSFSKEKSGTKLVFDWWILPESGTGMGIHHCLILGPILVITTIAGDLFESMMKRDSGIKDSGNLIPGHAG